ncbi:MAG TPA: 2-oxo acid dehydrogenase subunit E2 [Porphyromonadaceae bacterium]|jgi:pyruvate dehydrogenase E2 component (dihydrolipoamide acetyltransferase)|nr:2-oxo acid dehydrogenase subunit E2 [Porphyromonadaceae bacterium]
MAIAVIMPKQGQSVESCIITTLNKKEGDTVKKGEVLFSYETDKASFEEESPVDGTVLACFYGEGDEVPVLQNMMIVGEPGEDIASLLADIEGMAPGGNSGETGASVAPDAMQTDRQTDSLLEKAASSTHVDKALYGMQQQSGDSENRFVSPRAKKIAEKNAVPVSQLVGSGPEGRVVEKDVQAYLENRPRMTPLAKKVAVQGGVQPQAPGTGLAGTARAADLTAPVNAIYGVDYEDRKISNIRKLIARSMHASLQNSAQLTHHLGADARRILELRKKVKTALEEGKLSVNITLNDMVCFAVVRALKKYPEVNTHFLGDAKRYFHKVHLGLAVDTERGLMVPVLRNADDLSITGLSGQLKEIAAACRAGSVNPDMLAAEAGTFTVSNLGNYGVEMFTPVINLPQSAILGVNTIVPRPKDLGDGVYAFVPYIGLSLTYDHRSLDGGEATRFLKQIAIEIETLELDI